MNTAYNTGAIRRVCFPQNTLFKQFLNYQGVNYNISVVKSVVKLPEISLFSNVFTGGLGRKGDSLSLRVNYVSPVFTGLFSFINLKPE